MNKLIFTLLSLPTLSLVLAAQVNRFELFDSHSSSIEAEFGLSSGTHAQQSGFAAASAGSAVSFPARGVQLVAWLPVGEFGSQQTSANDCWGYVSPSGREYAILGLSDGTAFVDLTAPSSPQILTTIAGPISVWRDMKTYQDHAYSVSEGGAGIQVFDLSAIDAGSVQLVNTVVSSGGTESTHNVAIDSTSARLYRLGGGSEGLRIFDLSDPATPTFLGSWNVRYIHDAQVVTYTNGVYAGRQIAFACSGNNGGHTNTGIDILDVTDPTNVIVLANFQYQNAVYAHQCWLSEDRNFLYLNDELDEDGILPTTTIVIDVSDLALPTYVGSFSNGSQATGHNLYVKGSRIYEANYRSGLRIFDTSVSQTSPPEVAWFDTWPEDEMIGFNGLWSNFPFFPSGLVIGSDREKGLFVWSVGAPLLTFSIVGGAPAFIDPVGDSIVVNVAEENPGDLVPGTVQIHFDNGIGITSLALTDLGGGVFRADIPAVPCGQDFVYYFTAQSVDGIVWQGPAGENANVYTAAATLNQTIAFDFDMESGAPGWISGQSGDDATSGLWTLGDPNGTSAQPENDHTASGSQCWFTGQAAPGLPSNGNDVNGGTATLLSPILDMSNLLDPVVRYWRWYSNATGTFPGADVFRVSLSDDGGASWVDVEQVGPLGSEVKGGWIFHQVRVSDYFVPGSTMQVRFVASDRSGDSVIEAAIDDFAVVENGCADCNGNATSDDFDLLLGSVTDFDGNSVPDPCDPLSENANAISLSNGGSLTLQLNAGSPHANDFYWILGSATGTTPGLDFGSVNLPLNFDGYFKLLLKSPSFGAVFVNFLSLLDSNGQATASFIIPSGSDPTLSGVVLQHAYLSAQTFGVIEYASNAVPITLIP